MPKTKQQKQEEAKFLVEKLKDSKSAVFANYFGLKVKDTDELRLKCRKEGLSCTMAKKNLLKIALKDLGIKNPELEGEIMAIFGKDEISPAKTAHQFAKEHEALKVVAGVLDGRFADAQEIKALSALPSKEELLAKLVGSINSPRSGFVNALAGNLRNLVYVLNAINTNK